MKHYTQPEVFRGFPFALLDTFEGKLECDCRQSDLANMRMHAMLDTYKTATTTPFQSLYFISTIRLDYYGNT